MLPINQWSEDDRPREKLLFSGKRSLSDSELLAILIRTGSAKESAVDLAKKILKVCNNDLSVLAKLSVSDFIKFKGIGEAKAITIVSALELGQRQQNTVKLSFPKITDSQSVFQIIRSTFYDLEHEEFWVLFLNHSNRMIQRDQLGRGGITGTIIDIRLLLKKALAINATGMVLCHNHPSGDLTPSKADRMLTKQIHKASEFLDIRLIDHLIVHDNHYLSFKDEGVL